MRDLFFGLSLGFLMMSVLVMIGGAIMVVAHRPEAAFANVVAGFFLVALSVACRAVHSALSDS